MVLSGRSLGWVVLTVALAAVGGGLYFQASPEDAAPVDGPAFSLKAYKGGRGAFAGNTLPALRHSLATGVTDVMLDIYMTADGVPVAHGEPRLDPARTRAPNGRWIERPTPPLGTLTLEDLRAFDLGASRALQGGPRPFPDQARLDDVEILPLEEALQFGEAVAEGRLRYTLTLHTTPDGSAPAVPPRRQVVAAVADVVAAVGVAERTTLRAFDWRTLVVARDAAPAMTRSYATMEQAERDTVQRGEQGVSPWLAGVDVDTHLASVPHAIAAVERDGSREPGKSFRPWHVVWSPYYRDIRGGDVKRARRLGIEVVPWPVNAPATLRSLLALGVDGIATDYPTRLRRILSEKGRQPPRAYPDAAPDRP